MDVEKFMGLLMKENISFFTGVPDSLLKPFNTYLMETYGTSNNHIIAANEGNAVAIAAGYHLSTGDIPLVYLQNSGLGNIVNPVTSLLSDKVYGIPCIFLVGWRGEPGIHDEPQHVFQGEKTLDILEVLDIPFMILDKNTTEKQLQNGLSKFKDVLQIGKSVAIVVKKGGLSYNNKITYKNNYLTPREEIIDAITDISNEDIIVSTTGKTSRELFEIREKKGQSHKYDFLTVGSMGHCSSIALGVSLNVPSKKVWCIDGDGAALMHMGAMALVGEKSPKNFIHVIINNGAHESVGGQPTATKNINFCQIALGCGYKKAFHAANLAHFKKILSNLDEITGPIFIEVKSSIGSREDLGRPTKSPYQNKKEFMQYLLECN